MSSERRVLGLYLGSFLGDSLKHINDRGPTHYHAQCECSQCVLWEDWERNGTGLCETLIVKRRPFSGDSVLLEGVREVRVHLHHREVKGTYRWRWRPQGGRLTVEQIQTFRKNLRKGRDPPAEADPKNPPLKRIFLEGGNSMELDAKFTNGIVTIHIEGDFSPSADT